MAKTKRLIKSSTKSLICPIWIRNKDITFINVFYIREKVRQMLLLLDDNANYTSFSEKVYDHILIDGIDNGVELDYDLANELSKDLWLGALRNNMDGPDFLL